MVLTCDFPVPVAPRTKIKGSLIEDEGNMLPRLFARDLVHRNIGKKVVRLVLWFVGNFSSLLLQATNKADRGLLINPRTM